jgi:hypothetical protein
MISYSSRLSFRLSLRFREPLPSFPFCFDDTQQQIMFTCIPLALLLSPLTNYDSIHVVPRHSPIDEKMQISQIIKTFQTVSPLEWSISENLC